MVLAIAALPLFNGCIGFGDDSPQPAPPPPEAAREILVDDFEDGDDIPEPYFAGKWQVQGKDPVFSIEQDDTGNHYARVRNTGSDWSSLICSFGGYTELSEFDTLVFRAKRFDTEPGETYRYVGLPDRQTHRTSDICTYCGGHFGVQYPKVSDRWTWHVMYFGMLEQPGYGDRFEQLDAENVREIEFRGGGQYDFAVDDVKFIKLADIE